MFVLQELKYQDSDVEVWRDVDNLLINGNVDWDAVNTLGDFVYETDEEADKAWAAIVSLGGDHCYRITKG